MNLIREQIARLEKIEVPLTRRDDFRAFWDENRRLAAEIPLAAKVRVIDHPIGGLEVRAITFEGIDRTTIHGWLLLPKNRTGKVPALVNFHGAGGAAGEPHQYAAWVLMGCAVIAFDFRMQAGLTGSNTGFVAGRQMKWSNMGLLDKNDAYLRYAYTDALRAVRLATETAEIDAGKIAVNGSSQGGGIALACAALSNVPVAAAANVPSYCWIEKRIFERTGGFAAAADFLRCHPDRVDQVAETFSYFDVINMAGEIACPVLVSCGLKDPVCPPENVYAAYNLIRAEKEMAVYPFGEHDGGGIVHEERKLAFLKKHLLA